MSEPHFDPLCLIGPNGAGKSQFLQILAEIFQSVLHACLPDEERVEGNGDLQFEVEYDIHPEPGVKPVHVRISRYAEGKQRPVLKVQRKEGLDWIDCKLNAVKTRRLLPKKIVGYTSGDNETLSLPFLISRSGYAQDVAVRALHDAQKDSPVPDTRLMLVDYGTNLEVLVANLVLGSSEEREALLRDARLRDLHSFRCIVQLAHGAAPKLPKKRAANAARKGVQLTAELEQYVERLMRCSTCHTYDEKSETYTFDFWLNDETRKAFGFFWESTLELYAAIHKLSMLNDLAIPKTTRARFRRDTKTRRFASRLPEPQDEDKIFRFEQVRFLAQSGRNVVDYVSLSDGEHQLAQLLGMMCMVSFQNVLFLLDEPESHFNPHWRVKFISRLMELPTAHGRRTDAAGASWAQECLLTTHSPFVPSDMAREKVLIFGKKDGKVEVRHPDVETFGTTFDNILEECFGIRPPISDVPRKEIDQLMNSNDAEAIKEGLGRLGNSVEKVFLIDHLRQLSEQQGE